MQFGFNFDSLVIPTGSTTGQRILIDGVNGQIIVYDNNNEVRLRIGFPPGTLELGTGDASESSLGNLQAFVTGSGATRRLSTTLEPPTFAGRNRPAITLSSESFDGAVETAIAILADTIAFDRVLASGGDMTYKGISMPRGLMSGGRFTASGNDSARAAGVATDMTVTVSLVANRLYKVTLNSQFSLGTAGAVYAEELDHDGTIVGRFARQVPAETVAGSTLHYVGTTVDYVPSADDSSATLTVENAAGSGGTITAQPPTSGPRTLTVVDCGAV